MTGSKALFRAIGSPASPGCEAGLGMDEYATCNHAHFFLLSTGHF
ncbi:hypothetical protein BN871_GP_00100 [Paenibacillus sp. P22]|nr:hypothetical protein BN871_GP_00100 [Paenibacillus sp. P22]